MKRETKAALVDELARELGEADTMFVADYRGLDVPAITALRDRLRTVDASFRVVKNTMARRAAEQAGRPDIAELFTGPSAIAFARGDAAAVAKALDEVGKQTKVVSVRGGYMDGHVVDEAQVKEIALLPSREVILAMLLSAVNSPMTQIVGVLAAPCRDIVTVLDAYIEQRQNQEAAA